MLQKILQNKIDTPFGEKTIIAFDENQCSGFDFVFLCVSGSFSEKYGKSLTKNNEHVIDNSSYFRYDDDIPLVIPEINGFKALELLSLPTLTALLQYW
ncbi:MAG: hypothetical protein R2771_01140 [Saprospiraceae bacterium]